MDREKVIKAVEDAFDLVHSDFIGTDDFNEKEWEQNKADAIALLKEQEAVEPIPCFTETGVELQNYVICGHCKSIKAIMPKYTKQKYCHECGFPVLWEGR